MPDAVSEQHMRAMGVDPSVLGQPTSTARPQVSKDEPHEVQPSTGNPAFCRCGQPVATHPGAVQMMPRVHAEEEPPVERPHEPVNPYADALKRRQVLSEAAPIPVVADESIPPGEVRLRTPGHPDTVVLHGNPMDEHWGGPGAPTKQREGDQVLPTTSDRADVQSMVIADVEARRLVGISRYGTALQTFNGRDTILDLYEELLDATTYMRSLVEMRKAVATDLERVVAEALDGKVGTLDLPKDDRDRVVRGWSRAVSEALADHLTLRETT